MVSYLSRAILIALLCVGLAPAHADYQGRDPGGATVTWGAFTLAGVQLTKSVPVDPATGLPIFTSTAPGFVSIVGAPAVSVTGVATSANQTTGNNSLASIDGKLPTLITGRTPVDGSGVTQPVETIVRSTSTNRGGVLTTAGTAQTLVPANTARRGLAVQNRNAPGASYNAATSVFMSCQTTATQDFNSLEIPAGALYETPSHHSGIGACSFVSGTANTPVYVREF